MITPPKTKSEWRYRIIQEIQKGAAIPGYQITTDKILRAILPNANKTEEGLALSQFIYPIVWELEKAGYFETVILITGRISIWKIKPTFFQVK